MRGDSHPDPFAKGGLRRSHALSSFATQAIPDAGIGNVRPICSDALAGGCSASDQQVADGLVLALRVDKHATGEVGRGAPNLLEPHYTRKNTTKNSTLSGTNERTPRGKLPRYSNPVTVDTTVCLRQTVLKRYWVAPQLRSPSIRFGFGGCMLRVRVRLFT